MIWRRGGSDRGDEQVEELPDEMLPTYSVLLRRRPENWDFQAVSQTLQFQGGLSLADASRVARTRPGILLSNVARPEAKDVVVALREQGIDCFLAPDGHLFPPPNPATAESLSWSEDGFEANLASAGEFAFSVSYRYVALIAVAHITNVRPGGNVYAAEKKVSRGALQQSRQVLGFTKEYSRGELNVLDVYCGFTHRDEEQPRLASLLHVDATRFDFSCLGDDRPKDRLESLLLLTRHLAQRSPEAFFAGGTRAFVAEGEAPVSYENLAQFRADALWQLNLMEMERRKREKESS